MVSATAQYIIERALKKNGVIAQGQVMNGPQFEGQLQDALWSFNQLIDTWNSDNMNIYTIQILQTPVVGLLQSYEFGPGSANTWSIQNPDGTYSPYTILTRPPMLEGVWFQQLTTPPYNNLPVRMVSEKDWGNIRSSGITGNIANIGYYNQNFPIATLYLWPIPTGPGNIVVHAQGMLADNVVLNTLIYLPPGYSEALEYNLAVKIASDYGETPPEEVISRAYESKLSLERNNAQLPQRMDFDAAILGQPGGIYNVNSDQVLSW